MPQTIEGTLSARGLRFAIVASRFNGLIVEPLIAGALDAIVRSGGEADAVTIVRCPGAWELPQVVRKVIARGGVDAVIALGAVIRGETYHFEVVANESASGITMVALDSGVPVANGILTTESDDQAMARVSQKGADCALAAIEMANLLKHIE